MIDRHSMYPSLSPRPNPCTDPFRISTASDNSLYDANLPQVLQAVVHSLNVLSIGVASFSDPETP